MYVINQTRNAPLITQGRLADTFRLRLLGLLSTASLQQGEGLILVGEKSIHTFFMRFPIDVIYADKNHKVLRIDTNMVPFRVGPFVSRSAFVLEMPVGTVAATATQVGDQLEFKG